MELTPQLEDFSSKIFEKKQTALKTDEDINNRVIYLSYTKEDLERDIDSLGNQYLINLTYLIKAIEKKASSPEQNVYEVKDLNALREELTRIKTL